MFIGLIVDVLLNWGIFMIRTVGTFKDGVSRSHRGVAEGGEDGGIGYQEMQDQEDKDKAYAKAAGEDEFI